MDSVSRAGICLALAAILLLGAVGLSWAENIYVILYCDGAADMTKLTTQQKADLVVKYTPTAIQETKQWKDATATQKWNYFVSDVVPPQLLGRIQRNGVLPILQGLDDKFEIVDLYWKLAQEGTKYVFMLYLDPEAVLPRIKKWLDEQVVAGTLRYWAGPTMEAAVKALWQDRANPIAKVVGERIIKYPVQVLDSESGQQVTKFVPIKDAKEAYGATISSATLLQYKDQILPMKIFDGSK